MYMQMNIYYYSPLASDTETENVRQDFFLMDNKKEILLLNLIYNLVNNSQKPHLDIFFSHVSKTVCTQRKLCRLCVVAEFERFREAWLNRTLIPKFYLSRTTTYQREQLCRFFLSAVSTAPWRRRNGGQRLRGCAKKWRRLPRKAAAVLTAEIL